MSKKNDTTIHCTLRLDRDGVVAYVDPNGKDIALRMPWCGTVADIREAPPFYAISPCPYCGALDDRGHAPHNHTMPRLPVPERHRHCNACENGIAHRDGPEPCEICRGKGYWNAEDILRYHTNYPDLCKQSCGEKHSAPWLPTVEERAENQRLIDELPSVIERAKELLAKHGLIWLA